MSGTRTISPVWWPALGLALMLAANGIFDPGFLRVSILDGHLYGSPVDILSQGSRVMLLALGMTLVIATGGVDLSVGSVVAISASVCAHLVARGTPLPLVLAAAIGTGVVAGSINGLLVARLGLQPIVATLILMVAGRGVAQLITDGQVLIIANPSFAFLANGYLLGIPCSVWLVGGLFVLAHFALRRTAAGLFFEAVGENEAAARIAGLAAARIKALAYVVSGACAGLCGALAASHVQAADAYRAGENMELDAIFAVVVGGTALTGGRFFLWGSLIGALLLQTLTLGLYNFGVSPAVAPVPKALLIVAVALLQAEVVRGWARGLWTRRKVPA
jgi:ribose/xylose/arabinose/galactoside ABC-type transport system permease subunit